MKREIQSPELLAFLKSIIKAGNTVLDIGCGNKWYWQHINANFTGIDAWERFEPDMLLDLEVYDLPLFKARFDVVLMLDVIEHLSKARGEVILRQAKRIGKTVIILTPIQWDPNTQFVNDEKSDYYQNTYNTHKSVWHRGELFDFKAATVPRLVDNCFLGVWKGYFV
jgi:2-polyprenyl-3-methyl-5-hydroxy-6-metoxy-1,4-benzoquinol methylase